ncbi:hypothetical protein GCM10022226_47000 [Sphaerisporangium flaviroseum]|uniref:Uncharacterized protein n=1 Tax=Sphaerisporangium flaviroseum TaxID=509199 RepID=A0ABP7IL80_9ACTN
MSYSAEQIRQMVLHIEECEQCCGDDEEVRAGLFDESLPPEELADYIADTHSAQWKDVMKRAAADEET